MLIRIVLAYLVIGFSLGIVMYSTIPARTKTKIALVALMTFFWIPIFTVALLVAAYIHYGKIREIFSD